MQLKIVHYTGISKKRYKYKLEKRLIKYKTSISKNNNYKDMDFFNYRSCYKIYIKRNFKFNCKNNKKF